MIHTDNISCKEREQVCTLLDNLSGDNTFQCLNHLLGDKIFSFLTCFQGEKIQIPSLQKIEREIEALSIYNDSRSHSMDWVFKKYRKKKKDRLEKIIEKCHSALVTQDSDSL